MTMPTRIERHETDILILGTGGAIKNVADFWDEQPFMVINADIVADIDLKEVYRAHCSQRPRISAAISPG